MDAGQSDGERNQFLTQGNDESTAQLPSAPIDADSTSAVTDGTIDSNGTDNGTEKIAGNSSGSAVDDSRFLISISEDLPTLQECHDFCATPCCGAVSTFVGITRDSFAGRRVVKLSYEGYVPMGLKEMRGLCRDAVAAHPGVDRIAAVHILGDCPVGAASVILACSSPHRREAIRCSEFLIDELKGRLPIWKREVYEGEESAWKENVEWHEGRRKRVMVKEA